MESNENDSAQGQNTAPGDATDTPTPTPAPPNYSRMLVSWTLEPDTVVGRILEEVRVIIRDGKPTGSYLLKLSGTPDPLYLGFMPEMHTYPVDENKPPHPGVRVFHFPDGLTPVELESTQVIIPSVQMAGPINSIIGLIVTAVSASGPGCTIHAVPPSPYPGILFALGTLYLEFSPAGIMVHFPKSANIRQQLNGEEPRQ